MAGTTWLFWDGDCGFCAWSVNKLKRWDKRGRLTAVPYQEAPWPPMDQPLYEACADAVHTVGPDGKVLGGADAVFFALERMGGGWLAKLFRLPPLVWLMRGLYRLVANNRDKLSKMGFTQGEACGLKRSTGAPKNDA